MSAFAVKVSSDKQTLILAGEPLPPQRGNARRAATSGSELGLQLQRVTMLLVQRDYAATTLAADSGAPIDTPAVPSQSLVTYSPNRALSAGAAEYARMQKLSGDRPRRQLIDTYA